MRPSQVVEFAREKAEEVAEKTGEVIGKGLMEGWGKAKGLGEDLKKELLRLYRKTEGNKMSEKRWGSEESVTRRWKQRLARFGRSGSQSWIRGVQKRRDTPKSLSISASTTDSVLGGLSRHHPLRVGKGIEEIDSHFASWGLIETDNT